MKIEEKQTGAIFNIQSYSIHDGPGIRTTVFLTGCPLKCRWCANPESQRLGQKLFYYPEKCKGCGACIAVCHAAAVSPNGQTVKTDRALCDGCGACVDRCSFGARELSGRSISVDEVIKQATVDKVFFDASQGGVTLSGGEVLSQPGFAIAILRRLKELGIHTAIETSGFCSWDIFSQVLEYVDLVLYDLKHMDSKRHEWGTGVGNELILENSKRIVHTASKPLIARVPVIPGFNETEENMQKTADFVVKELNSDIHVCLLPYHNLGESKNDRMEVAQDLRFISSIPEDSYMQNLKELFELRGLTAQIGG
ncbi:MAG: glycyl-radical enzyme activating protein [Oscillospiraceae bacterium]|nr:glycyl-radical enzyme activating protein [Oscillospiraceae bacterium]